MNSRNPANRFIYANPPRRTYVQGVYGGRAYHSVTDRAGNKIPIYRELHVHRPGRGYAAREAANGLAVAAE